MLIGAIIGGICAGVAVRHWCWPWEHRVYVDRPVYVERERIVEEAPVEKK